jgi:uncharacterized protein YerC
MEITRDQFPNSKHEEIVAQIYFRRGFRTCQEIMKDDLFTINDLKKIKNFDIPRDEIIQLLLDTKIYWDIKINEFGIEVLF